MEKALERRLALQRATTAEVKRTAGAYRQLHSAAEVSPDEVAPERYRNPHDRTSHFDRLDRKDPAVLSFAHYALLVPGFKGRMRIVPSKAVDEYAEDDEGEFALISCPCGAKPIARQRVEKCSGCERFYVHDGKRALVIYGAMPVVGQPDSPGLEERSACPDGLCDGTGFVYVESEDTTYDCPCREAMIAARRSRRHS